MENFPDDNQKKRKSLSLAQGFGLVLFIFSAIVFLCLITGGALYGSIGGEIFIFLMGVLGYSAYAFFAAFIYAGIALFAGFKPHIKRSKLVLSIFLFVTIGLILQLITSDSIMNSGNIPTYGAYLGGVYEKGLEGFFGATFGGVIFGLISYLLFRPLSIAAYIILSIAALVLIFYLFNINKFLRSKYKKQYFDKPKLDIQGYKDYDLNLPADTEEQTGNVNKAPKKLFVANISEFKSNQKEIKKAKAYDLLLSKPKQETSSVVAFDSTQNSSDILFKKPNIANAYGKDLFIDNKSEQKTYADNFESTLEEKKKYILTPPKPEIRYPENRYSENTALSERSRPDEKMPKYIHDKILPDKKKKKYNVLENQITAYDLYKDNIEYDDIDFEEDEEIIPKRKEVRNDNIISDSTFSSKNIFDGNKKQALLDNFYEEEKPEIISFESRKKEIKKDKEVTTGFSEYKKFEVEDSFDVISDSGSDYDDYVEYSPYNAPPVELLHDPRLSQTDDYDDYDEKASELEKVLEDFKIFAKIVNITPSSSVTRYELQMPPGMPVARILNRADDIAMALSSVGDVRIEAPIPGKSLLGIEVPNKKRKIIVLKEVLETKEFFEAKSKMAFPLGRDINGNNYVVDIARMPHLLIAGATGSGKSVCLNSLIISLLYRAGPEDLRIILIDPKRVEFNIYADIPHLLIKSIVNEQDKAISAFNWAIEEMERRFALFKKKNAKDIDSYNDRIDRSAENKLARILIVVDELAELMSSKKAGEVEEKIQRLAQLSRAAGIHLVLATQRPSVDVITGLIKANMPSRIAFRVISQVDSRTIMDYAGAEKLLGDGDMIFTSANTPKPVRMQCPFISIEEIESVIEYVKSNNDAYFDESVFDSIMSQKPGGAGQGQNFNSDDVDPYLLEVLKLAIESNQISISMVQRRFAVGYARAGKIIDDLERQGLISPLDGSKPRQVLITMDEFNRRFGM